MLPIPLSLLSEDQITAVEAIFQAHYKEMFQHARNIVKSKADAEDVLSYSFQKIIENIDKISELPCPMRYQYCIVIVKNRAYQVYNNRKRECSFYDDELIKLPDPMDIEEEYVRHADAEQLVQAVDKLSREDRYLILLRFVYRQRYAEIAQLLGISPDAAQKRGRRILKKLLEILEEGDGLERTI